MGVSASWFQFGHLSSLCKTTRTLTSATASVPVSQGLKNVPEHVHRDSFVLPWVVLLSVHILLWVCPNELYPVLQELRTGARGVPHSWPGELAAAVLGLQSVWRQRGEGGLSGMTGAGPCLSPSLTLSLQPPAGPSHPSFLSEFLIP